MLKCIYENGKERTWEYDNIMEEVVDKYIKAIEKKQGLDYVKFLESPLTKVYLN